MIKVFCAAFTYAYSLATFCSAQEIYGCSRFAV